MNLSENYKKIKENVDKITTRLGRNSRDVRILAVTKTVPAQIVQKAINSGISLFGENRVQEALKKISVLEGAFEFHMIGHLQTNKIKHAITLFNTIQSIDKISTAQILNEEASKLKKKLIL